MRVLRNKSWQVLELRMVCYHSISTPPVFPIQSMMWQQGHTHWTPTPELGQLLPGSVSPLLAELMGTGFTQMMFIWRDFCSRATSSLVMEYKAAWSGSPCSGMVPVELHRSFHQIRTAGLELQHGSEIIISPWWNIWPRNLWKMSLWCIEIILFL